MTTTRARPSTVVSIGLGVLGVGGSACRPEVTPVARVVEIRDMAFEPAVVKARPGDTLVWVNRDIFPHMVTAADSSWSSPPLGQGDRWRLVAEEATAGTYACRFHPTMEGRITLTTSSRRRPQASSVIPSRPKQYESIARPVRRKGASRPSRQGYLP